MQKEHSQNIQELLDETNDRLKKIENEYLQKIESMVSKTQVVFLSGYEGCRRGAKIL